MTGNASVLGSLHSVDGEGVVRMEDRLDTGIDDLWGALTDPDRLAHWYGEVEGELFQGGEFRVRIAVAGERTGQVEACEPPQRLLLRMRDPDPQPGQPEQTVNEASEHHFGAPAAYMGEGGSIPFMGMLGQKFPQAQFLITGVLGPHSNAHGPNEFLHIPTGKKISMVVAEVVARHYQQGAKS